MELAYVPYQFNHPQSGRRRGMLVRLVSNGKTGFADFCPLVWPSDNFISEIAEGSEHFHWRRTLELANEDLKFDPENLKECELVNHLLVVQPQDVSLFKKGMKAKLKMGRDLRSEFSMIEQLIAAGLDKKNLRLDFNCYLTPHEFMKWWNEVGRRFLPYLDYVEDPFPFDAKLWMNLNKTVPLALDFGDRLNEDRARPWAKVQEFAREKCFSVLVVKPSLQNPQSVLDSLKGLEMRLVGSHLMDHPWGTVSSQLSFVCSLQEHNIPPEISGFELNYGANSTRETLGQPDLVEQFFAIFFKHDRKSVGGLLQIREAMRFAMMELAWTELR